MSIIDDLLQKTGLKYEDLNVAERETLQSWMEALGKNQLNLESVKQYITSMKESVEQELTKTDLNTKQDLFLKARLRNYMLLEAFLSTPERAKKALDKAISGLVGTKK
jgi:histidyl-tRNA synthetase